MEKESESSREGMRGIDLLPHRDPVLFLDRILRHDERSSVGEVTFGPQRDFFRGHFPSCPIVPGAVLLEAMTQSAAAGALAAQRDVGDDVSAERTLLFAGAEKVRFRRPVLPGETFETHAEVLRAGRTLSRFKVSGFVAGSLAAEAEIICVARQLQDTVK